MEKNKNNAELEYLLRKSRIASNSLFSLFTSNSSIDNSKIDDITVTKTINTLSNIDYLKSEVAEFNDFDAQEAFISVTNRINNNKQKSIYRLYIKSLSKIAISIIILLIPTNLSYENISDSLKREAIITNIPGSRLTAVLSDELGAEVTINSSMSEVVLSDNIVKNDAENSILSYKDNSFIKPIINKLKTPKGGLYKVVLSDGTIVTLNNDSYIKYQNVFNEKSREVTLVGEAIFDVVHKKSSPFIVKTQFGDIRVYGTQFNVKSYANDFSTAVTLIDGSVAFNNDIYSLKLKPGEKATTTSIKSNIEVTKVNINTELAWLNNNFDFIDIPLELVVNDLIRNYDVDIKIESMNLRNLEVTLYTSKDNSIEEVLSILRHNKVFSITQVGKSYILKNK